MKLQWMPESRCCWPRVVEEPLEIRGTNLAVDRSSGMQHSSMLKLDEMKILNEPDRLCIRHPGDWAMVIFGSSPQGTMVGRPGSKNTESFQLQQAKMLRNVQPRG